MPLTILPHPRRWSSRLGHVCAVFLLAMILSSCGRDARGVTAQRVGLDGLAYRVVTIDLRTHPLGLYWRDPDTHQPFASIEALRQWGSTHRRRLLFATNAGIYDRHGAPLGLYVEKGRTLVPLNTAHGDPRAGNFSLQPNGVFAIDRNGTATVHTTGDFHHTPPDALWATQSGPMLVIDGRINSHFVADSTSLKWRSGVCARTPHEVVFAISEGPVNFHSFAHLFRDRLGCRNALYLDGSISQFYVEGDYFGAPGFLVKPYAGMFAVFGKK